jgi:hypothetical protein
MAKALSDLMNLKQLVFCKIIGNLLFSLPRLLIEVYGKSIKLFVRSKKNTIKNREENTVRKPVFLA